MYFKKILYSRLILAIKKLYSVDVDENSLIIQETPEHFDGDFSLLTFKLSKQLKLNPEKIAKDISLHLQENNIDAKQIKSFVNITFSNKDYFRVFKENIYTNSFCSKQNIGNNKVFLVEFSSPNTNKPLHLGHLRTNLLGDSLGNLMKEVGFKEKKIQVINDRGVHICKSMVAWKNFASEKTPESAKIKGDHFVGEYYVRYNTELKRFLEENKNLLKNKTKEEAEKHFPLYKEVEQMLEDWEKKDKNVIALWKKMNTWVFDGFNETYKKIGISFDKNYYESDTYLLGKNLVKKGLEENVFFKKDDGSVWIDLKKYNLDEKLLLRSNGTSVYITQDIGTAVNRYQDYNFSKQVYVVGNEQDHHFKVLFLILKELGYKWAKDCFHLSYGMIELPEGKMKSREGTVVDADDLIKNLTNNVSEITNSLEKSKNYSEEYKKELNHKIAISAIKYYILKVNPKKKMLFDPKKSIDLNGNTGPFILYTNARIKSLLEKSEQTKLEIKNNIGNINKKEREIIKKLDGYKEMIIKSVEEMNLSFIAIYIYELSKIYNSFYQEHKILSEKNYDIKMFRLSLSEKVSNTVEKCCGILGISCPERI